MKYLDGQKFGNQFVFPVVFEPIFPESLIAHFVNYEEYINMKEVLKRYYNAIDTVQTDLAQFYTESSVLSLTLSGGVATQLSTMNRNHLNHLAPSEYTTRMVIGMKIATFLNNKFNKVKHDTKEFSFDIMKFPDQPFINLIIQGSLTFSGRKLNYYESMIFTTQGKILNQQLHLFPGETPFTCVKQTNDAIDSVQRINQYSGGQIPTNLVLTFLKSTNYDENLAMTRLQIVASLMQKGFSYEESLRVCETLQWNEAFLKQTQTLTKEQILQGLSQMNK